MDAPVLKLPLKAAYGLYLVKLCEECDRQSEALGYYVPHHPVSLAKFKRLRKTLNRGDLWYRGMKVR